ncbi:MAG: hypothetical protein ACHQ4J_02945 [Candidatus Binatia bacterium]
MKATMKPVRVGYSVEPYLLAGKLTGKWALTIVKKTDDGKTLTAQPLHFTKREFDSEQEAREYAARWIARRRD